MVASPMIWVLWELKNGPISKICSPIVSFGIGFLPYFWMNVIIPNRFKLGYRLGFFASTVKFLFRIDLTQEKFVFGQERQFLNVI